MSLHYLVTHNMTCVSLFITDNCCTNTRHTQLISSSLLMKNCSRLHHQSICRMTELSTDYDQEARRCCWPPAPQTTHIQQQYVMDSRTTRQHTVRVRPVSCCETKPRILSNQTCCLPTRDARWNISLWNIKKFHENFEIFQDPFLKYFMKFLIFNIKWLKTF